MHVLSGLGSIRINNRMSRRTPTSTIPPLFKDHGVLWETHGTTVHNPPGLRYIGTERISFVPLRASMPHQPLGRDLMGSLQITLACDLGGIPLYHPINLAPKEAQMFMLVEDPRP